MPYTSNPNQPKVRAHAVRLVLKQGWSMRQVARYLGVAPSTVSRWMEEVSSNVGNIHVLETKSSRPKTNPRAIAPELVSRILELRDTHRKHGPEVIHELLKREGAHVSFSTVYRTLKRHRRIAERSPWKKWHRSGERPRAEAPGILVQMDSIHLLHNHNLRDKTYIVTLVDVWSRWAFARASQRLTAPLAAQTAERAWQRAPFAFSCIQSDHGPEFTSAFTRMVEAQGIRHRHSRVRQPNDNAHVERFNRTIQEEMKTEIRKYKTNIPWLNRSISEYLEYYNTQRLHAGLGHQTPREVLQVLRRS